MDWLIPLAAKSFLIAGAALLLLRLLKNRSAADRSWIAHLALGGLLLLPVATVALPTLDVAGPNFLVGPAESDPLGSAGPALQPSETSVTAVPAAELPAVGGPAIDWPFWFYAIPAGLFIGITLIALARLFVLKARATVLVDAPWLTALARAQQRMGFKHGTALLTSNELPSPISWGVVRPVILLNTEASQSHDEAEAIITHELAHVANLDWAKLLIARVATALFWFNPLVWILAREAHQLREEAADDAVLATDIEDTEYARLLVGVARHECRGFLIGAHGVAPGRHSLSRRVRRVLDGAAMRAPGGWRWGSAAGFFAAGMAVPVAALNIVPASAPDAKEPVTVATAAAPTRPQAAAMTENQSKPVTRESMDEAIAAAVEAILAARAGTGSVMTHSDGKVVVGDPSEGMIKVYPPDSTGKRKTVIIGPGGSTHKFADTRALPGLAAAIAMHPHQPGMKASKSGSAVERAMALKAVGATPKYIAAIRSAAPQMKFSHDELVSMRTVGVTPAFVEELGRFGYGKVNGDSIVGAYTVGVREDYLRSLAAAGYGRLSMDQVARFRTLGITAADIERFKKAGFKKIDPDKLTELKMLGITPQELKASEEFEP